MRIKASANNCFWRFSIFFKNSFAYLWIQAHPDVISLMVAAFRCGSITCIKTANL
jgi:hypothetical protein